MALEDLLTKLIASLDANTAALKGAKGAATATATTGKVDKAEKITFDQVKVAATKLMERKGRPFVRKMITDVAGAKELAAVKPEKYPALFKAFEAALVETDEPDEAEEAEEDL